jgi:dinuclear metal center YbgI/SA1388 family protein
MPTVADMIDLMEEVAPSRLVEDWDNSGLQCGNPDQPVSRVMVALDPTPEVIQGACDAGAQLLITHHPLIFRPITTIDLRKPLGIMVETAVRSGLSVFCAHTNLDAAAGGLNDRFAEMIGLDDINVMSHSRPIEDTYKLVVYVPESHLDRVLEVFFAYEQGVIGNYSCCTFRQPGTGTFKPGMEARPFLGKTGEVASADEFRIEATVKSYAAQKLLSGLRKVHPYEAMAWDLYPLYGKSSEEGLGRTGMLPEAMDIAMLARRVKAALDIKTVRMVCARNPMVRKVAVCTGSGSGLLKDFFVSDADVFITGDLRYHDARELEMQKRAAIDVGHFASERLMLDMVQKKLSLKCRENNHDVVIETWKQERDPFVMC